MFVVDLDRHNDGEDGLVGPFDTRENAEMWVALTQENNWEYAYITYREVVAP